MVVRVCLLHCIGLRSSHSLFILCSRISRGLSVTETKSSMASTNHHGAERGYIAPAEPWLGPASVCDTGMSVVFEPNGVPIVEYADTLHAMLRLYSLSSGVTKMYTFGQ